MGRFEPQRQCRDDQSSEERRNPHAKQQSAYAGPHESQWYEVSPSVVISPTSDDSAEEEIRQAVPSKHNPDAEGTEMIKVRNQQTQPGKDPTVESAVTEDKRHGSAAARRVQNG